jgi:nucleotide-binding universal stress UspA family protein
MSTILAAVDRTPTARPVLETARLLARTFHADAEALHVVALREDPPANLAATAGMPLRILTGDPVEVICDAVADHVDLVVLGARRAPSDGRPVGHVAFDVMTRLEVPVVVVPPDAWEHLPHTLKKALVPLDAATADTPILQAALAALADAGAEVVVLHVVDEPPRFLDHPERDLDEWAHQRVGRHLPVAARTEIRSGGKGRNALMVAAAEQVDLIVLGWSRRLDAGHAAIVRDILNRACVPVLLLPVGGQVGPLTRLAGGIPA